MRRRVSTLVRATGLFNGTRTTSSQSCGLINSSFARRLRVEALEDRRMLAVTVDFTGAYVMENWLTTAIAGGSSSKSPAFGATDEPVFGYTVNLPSGTGVSQRKADFQLTNSPVTGSVTFDYVYTGNHFFSQAAAEFDTLVSSAPTTVVNQSTSGGFTFSGSATIIARAGESFGFRIGGMNNDSSSHISGTLTITNFRAYDSIVVDSVSDTVDGDYSPGNLTLREAIELANTIPGADTITFAESMSGQTILLGGAQLDITEAVTIDATTLAENVAIDAQQQSRVINFSAEFGDLTLAGLTMRNGRTTGDGFSESGGGIRSDSSGTLTLSKSILSGNTTSGDNADGGGIFTSSGAVTLINSNVLGNSTTGPNAGGGAIFSSGNVTLTGSTLSGNSTAGNIASGGGIFTSGGSVTLTNSTLSGNSTAGSSSRGGGIRSFYGAVTLNQSTLSGNSTGGATSEGGGIYSNRGVVTLNQSTLTGNGTTGTGANGGGIFVANSSYDPLLTIRNSILAGNLVAAGSFGPDLVPDGDSTLEVNFSLIGTGITPTAGGNNISTDEPLLGPLADNGGPTQTHALLPGSPALDAGDPNGATSIAVHVYELNGSLADELGGPSLVVGGGFLLADGYQFGPNEGPQVSSAITPDDYTIELVFSFDELGGYQKIIDTHDLSDDSGLYSIGNSLHFYDGGVDAIAENVLTANTLTHLVVTRDSATDAVAVYVDGVQVMSFVDTGGIAEFTGLSNVVRFFQDDNATGGSESASGFVDRIRIYDHDLSADEVGALLFDQRGPGFLRVVDGDGDGGARMDIGAFEAVPLVVNDAGDSDDGDIYNGVTTLREAINQANAIGGADVITFDPEMSGHVILMDGSELEITDTLMIDAAALDENVIIDAQQQSRVMHFTAASGDLTLAGLTMQNGRTTGNDNDGGGIRFGSDGTLALMGSTLSGNSTLGDSSDGGGIFTSSGAVILTDSTLSGNSTSGNFADGGGIFTTSGAVMLNQSTLSGNSTAATGNAAGGGICTFYGAVTLYQSTLSGNSTAGVYAAGGGIFTESGAVTLNQSTLSGNSTAGNDAVGGGIYTDSGAVTLINSTLSGNSTTGQTAKGGGIYTFSGAVKLNHSTVTGNRTTGAGANGGGIYIHNSVANPLVKIHNSILAGNTVAAAIGSDLVRDPQSVVDVNFSVIGTGIIPTAGGNNIFTNAPLLGPLADNGGPTQTHALLPGSPALDAGDPNGATSNAVHVYELNNSLADELGGPSLVVGGGFLLADGYQFGLNEGPQVSSAITPDEYSIELVFSFDALGGYQKIIDTHDLGDDSGLYSTGTGLDFYNAGAFAADVLSPGVPVHLVVTRDAATDAVAVYVDGIEVLSFVDGGDIAVFNGISEVVRFFQDDNATGGAEAAAGFVDRIRIYDRDLSAGEVAGLLFDQRGLGFDRVADGDGTPGARVDIGAYEAQVNPSADFDGDGDVDGRDFLAWQRGFGTSNAVRADGNSDDDADVDGSDLAAWQGQYGTTGLNELVAAVTATSAEASIQPAAFDGGLLIDAAMLLAMMEDSNEETAADIAPLTFSSAVADEATFLAARFAPPSRDGSAFNLIFDDSPQSEIDFEPWLSEELLERVFG